MQINPVFKHNAFEIKWGLYFVLMTWLWMVIERLAGLHGSHIAMHSTYTNLYAIPALIVFYLALARKNSLYFSGRMTWWQGFKTGIIITLVVVILSPLTQVVVLKLISPDFIKNMINFVIETKKYSLDQAESSYNVGIYIAKGLIGTAVMGTFTSALVSLFIRYFPPKKIQSS